MASAMSGNSTRFPEILTPGTDTRYTGHVAGSNEVPFETPEITTDFPLKQLVIINAEIFLQGGVRFSGGIPHPIQG